MTIKEFTKSIFESIKSNWYLAVTEHQIFSTEETVVGTWLNKPLYQKLITVTVPSKESSVAITAIPSTATNIRIAGCDIPTGNGYSCCIGYDGFDVCIKNDGKEVYFKVGTNPYLIGSKATLIVQYTKSADSASTSKVPFESLVEYSKQEKLVGYYIDGDPIYKRTYTGTIPTGTNTNFITFPTGFSKLIKTEGIARLSTGNELDINNGEWLVYKTKNGIGCTDHTSGNGYAGGTYEITLYYTKVS